MKTFHCDRCQQLVFFENVRCERCAALLGYVPQSGEISAFEDAGDGLWRRLGAGQPGASTAPRESAETSDGPLFRQCHNYAVENVCNWMIPADSPDTLCRSCRFTRTIPNLDRSDNRLYWYRLEAAKRRLLYTLMALNLPVRPRAEDPKRGLAFEFLEDTAEDKKVMTGHNRGVITVNIAEADDAHREQTRSALGEPYRTLLGHFRHETGHYFFDRLVTGRRGLAQFRKLFGDERADYGAALAAYYRDGPRADWAQSYISAYATMHPWEDWAETWAHYLHIVDTLDTATACGLVLIPERPHEPTLTDRTPVDEASFDDLMARWFPLTYVLNSLNRSLGMPDGYPFTLPPPVIDKLRFVHRVVVAGAASTAAPVASRP